MSGYLTPWTDLSSLSCLLEYGQFTGGDPTCHDTQDSHSILTHSECSSKEGQFHTSSNNVQRTLYTTDILPAWYQS